MLSVETMGDLGVLLGCKTNPVLSLAWVQVERY